MAPVETQPTGAISLNEEGPLDQGGNRCESQDGTFVRISLVIISDNSEFKFNPGDIAKTKRLAVRLKESWVFELEMFPLANRSLEHVIPGFDVFLSSIERQGEQSQQQVFTSIGAEGI